MRCGNSGSTIVRLNQIIVFSFYLPIKLDTDNMTDKSLVLEQDKHQFSKETDRHAPWCLFKMLALAFIVFV